MTARKQTLKGRYTSCPVKCPMVPEVISSLSGFIELLDVAFKSPPTHKWFRGHSNLAWRLAPSALRYRKPANIKKALALLTDFKRVADFRIDRPPPFSDGLRWMQLAQHHGLPTRLLDWTSNAAIALYFACLREDRDGMVFFMDPTHLNLRVLGGQRRLLDPEEDQAVIKPYLRLTEKRQANGKHRTVAIQPVINSERIQLQRGAFTLHGNRHFDLGTEEATSLCYLPILKEHKATLLGQLADVGVDEMSIFPEHEHLCSHLTRAAGLPKDFNDA